jgi:DNA-binding response OmpR family regulator
METIASVPSSPRDTILVVDDELQLLDLIGRALQRAGYCVLTARDGLDALDILEVQAVDLIIADIVMPRMNGYQLHERLVQHPRWVSIPLLFLSARAQDSDIRYGKELGVDDYLTKPFNIQDLLAAVRGRLRRAQQLAGAPAILTPFPSPTRGGVRGEVGEGAASTARGCLRIDAGQYRVWLNGRPVKLSTREFRLLECLARRSDQVIPLEELIQVTHGLQARYDEASNLLRPLVRSLRRKLGYQAGELGCIESVRGVGYQFIDP